MIIDNDKLKFISRLSTHEIETITSLVRRLETLSDKKELTEIYWRDLSNLVNDIQLYRECITTRVINLLKTNMEV